MVALLLSIMPGILCILRSQNELLYVIQVCWNLNILKEE